MAPLLVELFAGSGTVAAVARGRGWDTLTVDLNPDSFPDIVADVATWEPKDVRTPSLVWASPPCVEFARESMPWCATGMRPSMRLVHAVHRLIGLLRPTFWVMENVRGAQPWIGRAVQRSGPFYLWGWWPVGRVPDVGPSKMASTGATLAGRQERAKIPEALAAAVLEACEGGLAKAVKAEPRSERRHPPTPLFPSGWVEA